MELTLSRDWFQAHPLLRRRANHHWLILRGFVQPCCKPQHRPYDLFPSIPLLYIFRMLELTQFNINYNSLISLHNLVSFPTVKRPKFIYITSNSSFFCYARMFPAKDMRGQDLSGISPVIPECSYRVSIND